MNAQTDWTSAIAILVAGLIVGVLFVVFYGRRKSASLKTDLDRKDLEAKRDALIAQLRALPDDAVDERERLERETADVLRKLDEHVPPVAAPRATGNGQRATAMSPAIKGFLWGAGTFAALATLAYFVMRSSTPREQQTNTPMQQQQQAQQPDPFLQQLEAAVQRDPENARLRNNLAQAYLERDNLMAVFEQTKIVLAKNPNDARALTFQALVRMAMGEGDTATAMLQQAVKVDPANLDGWVALAWVYSQSDRMKDAEAAIAEAIRVSPNDKARLEEVLQQMKAQAAAPQQAASPLPADHPPLDAPPAAPPPASAAASTGRSVRVTLDLDAAASTRSGVLFVMARNPAGGPPIAVKRVVATAFPLTVDLGAADSMMGQQLPDRFRVEARLDTDGDAATKPPSDPKAMLDNVAPGAVVTLSLK